MTTPLNIVISSEKRRNLLLLLKDPPKRSGMADFSPVLVMDLVRVLHEGTDRQHPEVELLPVTYHLDRGGSMRALSQRGRVSGSRRL